MIKLQQIYERLNTKQLIGHHFGTKFSNWFNDSQIVNEKGMPLRVYHQTDARNVESITNDGFKIGKGKSRLGDPSVPNGIFFKPDGKDIGLGGKNSEQIGVYLSIQNPLIRKDTKDLEQQISGINSTYHIQYKNMRQKEDWYDKKIEQINKKVTRDNITKYRKITSTIFDEWGKWYESECESLRNLITDTLVENGYDGVIIDKDEGSFGRVTTTFIALYPNQVKSRKSIEFSLDNNSINEVKKKVSKYQEVKGEIERSRSIPKDMKEKILQHINSGSRYNKGSVYGLKKKVIPGKSFSGVSLGADKNGFFVYTHRARSKSYGEIDKISKKSLSFIESTG